MPLPADPPIDPADPPINPAAGATIDPAAGATPLSATSLSAATLSAATLLTEWAAPMRRALELARAAGSAGDVPVGAVVLGPDARVIGAAGNAREADGDPTAHAEILAIRQASATIGNWRLHGCTLVVTLEPCAMCAGALVLARVDQLVFGALDPKAGAVGSLYDIPGDPRLNHRPKVHSGVFADESSALLRAFFAGRRRRRSDGARAHAADSSDEPPVR